jgi:DNA-binding PadR family transcriptional regulator
MGTKRRITSQTEDILAMFMSDPEAELSAAEIEIATKIKKGTVYPAMTRMTRFKWVEWRWEEIDPKVAGRPRKRFYKLTGQGERAAREIASEAAARERQRELKRARVLPAPEATI